MCWNFDEEKISRAAVFITDCSRDKRCDETPTRCSNSLRAVSCSRNLGSTLKLEIGVYKLGSAGSLLDFLTRGMIYAVLKLSGTWPVDNERLKTSTVKALMRLTTAFSLTK